MAIDRQNLFHTAFPEERPAAHNDLFALVIRNNTFSGRVGELVGFDHGYSEIGRARNNCFGEGMFGLAFRDAGSGQNFSLSRTVG